MISYTTSKTNADLERILKLQKINLKTELGSDEIINQGFLSLQYNLELLSQFNQLEKHIIAKEGEAVVGYILALTKAVEWDLPFLSSLFKVFDVVFYKGKVISSYNYLMVGQVCVAKGYRGQGIFDHCYSAYRAQYATKYDFAITVIATTNPRSINAHKRIGWNEVHRYLDEDQTEWVIVIWDWEKMDYTQ